MARQHPVIPRQTVELFHRLDQGIVIPAVQIGAADIPGKQGIPGEKAEDS